MKFKELVIEIPEDYTESQFKGLLTNLSDLLIEHKVTSDKIVAYETTRRQATQNAYSAGYAKGRSAGYQERSLE